MRAFYFGTTERPLFGLYEPPVGSDLRRGVVICNAIGAEYYSSYRVCRALARRISNRGAHVLRFDYIGTGNSGGEPDAFELSDWVDNVGQAVEELKDMTGLRKAILVGFRAGAVIAARAIESRRDIDQLVVWSPISPRADSADAGLVPSRFLDELESWAVPGSGLASVPTRVVSAPVGAEAEAGNSSDSSHAAPADNVDGSASAMPRLDGYDLGSGGLPTGALNDVADWVTGEV